MNCLFIIELYITIFIQKSSKYKTMYEQSNNLKIYCKKFMEYPYCS